MFSPGLVAHREVNVQKNSPSKAITDFRGFWVENSQNRGKTLRFWSIYWIFHGFSVLFRNATCYQTSLAWGSETSIWTSARNDRPDGYVRACDKPIWRNWRLFWVDSKRAHIRTVQRASYFLPTDAPRGSLAIFLRNFGREWSSDNAGAGARWNRQFGALCSEIILIGVLRKSMGRKVDEMHYPMTDCCEAIRWCCNIKQLHESTLGHLGWRNRLKSEFGSRVWTEFGVIKNMHVTVYQ